MSQTPEKIVMNYDSKSKQSKNVALEMKKIVERYRGKRVHQGKRVCFGFNTHAPGPKPQNGFWSR